MGLHAAGLDAGVANGAVPRRVDDDLLGWGDRQKEVDRGFDFIDLGSRLSFPGECCIAAGRQTRQP